VLEHGLAVNAELDGELADGATCFVLSDELCNSLVGEPDLPLQCTDGRLWSWGSSRNGLVPEVHCLVHKV
jgi:hypothetical protein